MRISTLTAAALAASVALPGSLAQAGFIFGQGADGDVYRIDTSNASTTRYKDLSDFDTDPNEANNSPNALGYNGDFFRTDFPESDGENTLYRNDTPLKSFDTGARTRFSVAAGDVTGSTYHLIDGDGGYRTVSNINGDPGDQDLSPRTDLGIADPFGDLAIRGNKMFVSYQDMFSVFDLDDLESGATQTFELQRFAGLAFAGDELFGVTGGFDETSDLYKIDLGEQSASKVASTGVALTDAATVPLPAAAWLMIGGLGAIGAFARKARKAAPTA
ncbi:MAG: VPLPA-CTERM sorting domain-containing protein [Alphaproteobacteria bacterium]